MEIDVEAAIVKLVAYCRANDWAGYDPYDAHSSLFRALPFWITVFRDSLYTGVKASLSTFDACSTFPRPRIPKPSVSFFRVRHA
jgi:hypothetical protein